MRAPCVRPGSHVGALLGALSEAPVHVVGTFKLGRWMPQGAGGERNSGWHSAAVGAGAALALDDAPVVFNTSTYLLRMETEPPGPR